MTADRMLELRRLILEQGSGVAPADTDPWLLLGEVLDGLSALVEFLQAVREPIGDLTEALEDLEG